MKCVSVFILLKIFTLTAANPVADQTAQEVQNTYNGYHKYTLADRDYLKKYKDILSLFKYVHQPTYDKEQLYILKHFKIESNLDSYTNTKAVEQFLNLFSRGQLFTKETFSVFNDDHLKLVIALFKVLYYAKDFDTFYKTAAWARCNLNHGLFLYAFSVALIHHHATYSMILPPIYEIYPYYFFGAEVIQKSQEDKQRYIQGTYEYFTVSNYPRSPLSYFTEDIGVNAYYYYYNLYRPFWMDAKEFDINTYYRGEEFYYFYQQVLARYNLEKLTNGVGEGEVCNNNGDIKTVLRYPNGLTFPDFVTNNYNESYGEVADYERRIRDAIDFGYIYDNDGQKINLSGSDGFNILCNIIESNPDTPNRRFYGQLQLLTHQFLGFHGLRGPSFLAHFETSLRDPVFWQVYKKLLSYLERYKNYLPSYTRDELLYPGIMIESVEVDRLTTYFEFHQVDISNAVYVNANEWESSSFVFHVYQKRLNHRPFTYRINLWSDGIAEAVVRVFIGPKFDVHKRVIPIDENRLNFVEFDKFKFKLQNRQNVIERSSNQIYYSTDRMSYKQLHKLTTSGMNGTEKFVTHGSEVYYAFPNRLLLPKGTISGQTFQFYVMVTPYHPPTRLRKIEEEEEEEEQSIQHIYDELHEGEEYEYFKNPMVGLGVQYMDNYPLGYPLDKRIDNNNFNVPNSYFQDVVIYHED